MSSIPHWRNMPQYVRFGFLITITVESTIVWDMSQKTTDSSERCNNSIFRVEEKMKQKKNTSNKQSVLVTSLAYSSIMKIRY
jgi:hypothetical protein